MSLEDLDDWIAATCASTRELRAFLKASATAEGAGTWHSLWKVAGNYPGAGATPPAYTAGSGYLPTEATAGAFPITDPGGSNKKYLNLLQLGGPTIGRVIFYDRVWHCSGFSTNTTGTQSITTPGNVDRPSGGVGLEPWVEFYGAAGTTGATWTLNFTDSDEAANTATYDHPTNAETVGQICPMVMAAGCRGIKSPTSFVCSAASGTAGDVGITLLRRIAEIPIALANVGDLASALRLGLPELAANTCLAAMVLCSTTSTGIIAGIAHYCEG